MICFLRVLSAASQVHIDVCVTLTILLALIDPGHFVPVLAVLVVVVVASVVRMALLVEIVENARAVLLHFDDVLVADGEELDDLSEHTAPIGVDEAGDDFVGDVTRRGAQHLLELRC